MRRWVAIAVSYVGAVVGAGFASGRELVHFFLRHGAVGLAGVACAGVFFCLSGVTVLDVASTEGLRHHGQLLRRLCGQQLGAALDRVMSIFLVLTVASVLAGAGALTFRWGIGRWPGAVGLGLVLLLSGAAGRRGNAAVNALMVPTLAGVSLWAVLRGGQAPYAAGSFHADLSLVPLRWLLDALLYVAYNLVLALAGMCASLASETPPADARRAGFAGGVGLTALCAALCLGLWRAGPQAVLAEIPTRSLYPPTWAGGLLFSVCMLAALWTTGSAAVTALSVRLSQFPVIWTAFGCVAAALPLAMGGLVWLVGVIYPLMGYAGLPLLAAVVLAAGRRRGARPPIS
jgi:uncharacterized membrane protein YkvI